MLPVAPPILQTYLILLGPNHQRYHQTYLILSYLTWTRHAPSSTTGIPHLSHSSAPGSPPTSPPPPLPGVNILLKISRKNKRFGQKLKLLWFEEKYWSLASPEKLTISRPRARIGSVSKINLLIRVPLPTWSTVTPAHETVCHFTNQTWDCGRWDLTQISPSYLWHIDSFKQMWQQTWDRASEGVPGSTLDK